MSSDTVTWIGTIITIIGTGITIWQAALARSYKNQIRIDIRKLSILRSAERLRRALDFIRKLPSKSSSVPRGAKPESLVEPVKECFDEVLGVLPVGGEDKDIREKVQEAQTHLTTYETALSTQQISPELTAPIQRSVQEAVSKATQRSLLIEGKA